MDTGRISARYAKALYEFAVENNKAEAIYESMKIVSSSFASVPELNKALVNPQVSKEKKKGLLIASAGSDVCPEFEKFLDLVLEHKREAYFQTISLVYQDVYRKAKNIVVGRLETAQEVSNADKDKLKAIVEEKTNANVEFVTNVNPELIGGFLLQVGTYQLDASVSSQLRIIKDSLLRNGSANS